jgi:hypothetical protein
MLTRMTWLRRHPRLAFFALGVLVAAAGFWPLVYLLGPERGLIRIDSETLVIRLGPDGRVSDYRVVRD